MHGSRIIYYLFHSSVEHVESGAPAGICHAKIFCMIILAFDLTKVGLQWDFVDSLRASSRLGRSLPWLLWCGLCPVWDVGAFGVVGGRVLCVGRI
ncbi:hypothetical protein A4G26_18715 [Mycobacterium kansasii]|nr:hypothetical protein A4G26_18715 [Mycobacterium kansasii]